MDQAREAGRRGKRPAPLDAAQRQALLGEAAAHRVAGRYDEAIVLYERIERANPDEANATYFLALIDLVRERPAPALKRLTRLVRRMPTSFEAWQALAHTLRELGQWREAIEASRRALALKPEHVGEKLELASALEVAGDLDEALRVLRALADGTPGRLSALIRIARLRPADITPDELATIAVAARSGQAPAEQRSAANAALGEALERRGRYDDAFEAFAAANQLRRGMLTGQIASPDRPLFAPPTRALDPAEAERLDAEQVRFMKAVFTPEFIAAREGGGHHLAAPIFIVGMPRSGSTLIEQILSSHPRVQGLGETGALAEAVGEAFPVKLFEPEGRGHFRRLAEDYLAGMHRRGWGGAARFVDKMPHNYVNVGMIHLMFPKAVILHSTRDAADTCLANFRIQFQTGQEASYDLGDIGRQYVRYREMMDHWNAVLPGRVIDVAHEALVSDPDAQIRWLVTEACGLDWDHACLAFHKTRRAVRTASVAQVRQPIFTSSVERWRRYEAHLGPLFDALGPYAPTRSPHAAKQGASAARAQSPTLDLRSCRTLAISLRDDTRRREALASVGERTGLPIEIIDGVRADPGRIGCALGHLRILRDKSNALPITVLEDDVDLTEDFRPEITYPADADALYLGASVWGALELMEYDAYANLVIAEDVGAPWVRVFNLLSTHAMVYLTDLFRDGVIEAIMECVTERDWAHDRGVARIQGEFKVYALRRPMFYQSDALQRPGVEAEAMTRVELQPTRPGLTGTASVSGEWKPITLARTDDGRLQWRWTQPL